MKAMCMRGFLAIVLVSSLGAMQEKAKFTGESPALVGKAGESPALVGVQPQEDLLKVLASGRFITSLNDLEEWKNLKTTVETLYPDDKDNKRVWDRCERDLYTFLDESFRHSDVGGIFDRAKEAFKVIAEFISVSKGAIEKNLKSKEMRQEAKKAFAKHFYAYIDDVLRDTLSKRSVSKKDIDTIARRFFARWFEQWQKIYRLKIRHQKAVKNIETFSQEIALGEMLTFAFVTLKDYQDVRTIYKEKSGLENRQIDKPHQVAESLKLPPEIEKEIARRIVHNYCALRGKMPARDQEAMLNQLEQPARVHELIEQIRLLPGCYKEAPEEFDALFKALKDSQALPLVEAKDQPAAFLEVGIKAILFGEKQDVKVEDKIEAFAQHSLQAFDKSFDSSKREPWLAQTLLVNYLKKHAERLFADNAPVSWLFQNYLSVALALHRYAFIIMADETLSQEKRKQIIDAVGALRAKFLKDCLTIYRRDPESLKLYVENCLVQDLNKELGGFLGVAESLGAELELGQRRGEGASVYHQDYLFRRAESSHNDPLFGVVGNIPPSISDLLPQGLKFYHLTVGAQAGNTCFYQAVVNARVLEALIKAGHAVSGKALRDGAEKYDAVIKEACKQETDDAQNQQNFLATNGPKQKLVSQHLSAELFQDKNYSGSFRFDEALKFAVENLKEKSKRGVVNILCIYNDSESTDYHHAFVLSFVKLKEDDPVRLLYMESNNLYLEEPGTETDWWIRFLKAFPKHLKHIIDIVRPELGLP